MSHGKVTASPEGVLEIAHHAVEPLTSTGDPLIASLLLTIILMATGASVAITVLWRALGRANQYSQTRDGQVLETLTGIRTSIEAVLKARGV